MATLTISAAARLCRRDRRTLQRAIRAGLLHLDAQHRLNRDELVQLGYLDAEPPHPAPQPLPQALSQGTSLLALLERLTTAVEALHQELHQIHETVRQLPQPVPHPAPHPAPQPVPQPPHTRSPARTPETDAPPYDPTKYVLGRLCRRGHAYGATGQTLLRLPAFQCRQCQAERARERRAAQRTAGQAQPQR